MEDETLGFEVSLIDDFRVGFSEEERLVAVLLSTKAGQIVNAAMTAQAALELGEDLIKAAARLQDLKTRDN